MQYKEEGYAQHLYTTLQETFKPNFIVRLLGLPKQKVTVSIEGNGSQWKCFVSKGINQCEISCIHIDRIDTNYKGPEYYTRFKTNGKIVTEGRTFQKTKTIEAVKLWMNNQSLEKLYEQFSFIDEEKRNLEKIRASILELNPREFEIPQGEVITDHFNVSSLWFINKKRSCRIYFHGYDPTPRYLFYWVDDLVFESSGSNKKRVASLLGNYVFDKQSPITLKEHFPEIDFGKYVSYYEQENTIN